MAIKSPSNLLKSRHGIFYYRIVFPEHLSPIQKELRTSLYTHKSGTALQKASFMNFAVVAFLTNVKSMDKPNTELLKNWLKNTSASWEENGDKLMIRGLKLFDLEIEQVEVNGEEDSEHFSKMIENLTKGKTHNILEIAESPLLSEIIPQFLSHLTEKGKKIKSKTMEEYRVKLTLFLEIVGDMKVSNLSEQHIIAYRNILEKLPPNRNKKKEFIGLTAIEAAQINTGKTISITTVQNTMIRVSTLCNWCRDRKLIDFNPVTDFIPETKLKKNTSRISFQDEDLLELFGNREILTFSKKDITAYAYWSGLLALYTGARLEEICMLRIECFHLDEKTPYVLIEPYFDTQFNTMIELKTPGSERRIPLHPDLKKMGFFDYVKGMEKAGFYKIFPELALLRDGFGGRVSKWFARFKERHLSCNDMGKKTFHSFRHTFINRLKNSGVDDRFITELIGHTGEKKSKLDVHYVDEIELSELYKIIKILDYPVNKFSPQMKDVSKKLIRYAEGYAITKPEDLKPSIMGESR